MQRILIWILVILVAVLVVQSLFIVYLTGDATKKATQLQNKLSTVVGEVRKDFREKCTVDDTLPAVKLKESIDKVEQLEERLAICDKANATAQETEAKVAALVESSDWLTKFLEAVPQNAADAKEAAGRALEILPADPAWFGELSSTVNSLSAATDALSSCDGAEDLCDSERRLALARILKVLATDSRSTHRAVTGQDDPKTLYKRLSDQDGKVREVLEEATRDLVDAINGPALARDWLREYAQRSKDSVSARLEGKTLQITMGQPAEAATDRAPALACEDFDVTVGAYRDPESPALRSNVAYSGNLLVDHRGPSQATVLFNHRPLFGLAVQKALATRDGKCVAEVSLTDSEVQMLAKNSDETLLSIEILMPARNRIEVAYDVPNRR